MEVEVRICGKDSRLCPRPRGVVGVGVRQLDLIPFGEG